MANFPRLASTSEASPVILKNQVIPGRLRMAEAMAAFFPLRIASVLVMWLTKISPTGASSFFPRAGSSADARGASLSWERQRLTLSRTLPESPGIGTTETSAVAPSGPAMLKLAARMELPSLAVQPSGGVTLTFFAALAAGAVASF